MDTLKLFKPIKPHGVEVNELKYDFDNLTAQDKLNAGKKYKKAGGVVSVQELDCDYHLYIFAEAVRKADPSIDETDILLLSAKDSAKAESLVRDFFYLNSEDSSQMNTSGKQ